jgi:sortase A
MTPRPRFRWLQRGLLILGILLLALWSKSYFESSAFQSAESKKLETAIGPSEAAASESEPAALHAPRSSKHARQRMALGKGVLGKIEIPRLRIGAIIAEGSDVKTLRRAVGHIKGTALPGKPGNCALAGHRDTFLRGLGGIREDDTIRVVTPERTYAYRVEWSSVVKPQRVDVVDSTATRSLTLITCYPFVYVGHAPKRFVVRAKQIEATASSAAPVGRDAFQPQSLTAEGR